MAHPVHVFRTGQSVFWEGDPASSVFFVASGVLRVSRFLPDGRRGIMAFLFPGEMLGLSSWGQHEFTAEAVTDARLHCIPRERLHELASATPSLRNALFAAIGNELCAAQEQLLMLSQKSAEERVASFLLFIARKTGRAVGQQVEIQAPMSRLDMADSLGLTVETVCRAVSKLKREGYISLVGRHTIMLRRPADLMRFAGDRDDDPASTSPSVDSAHVIELFAGRPNAAKLMDLGHPRHGSLMGSPRPVAWTGSFEPQGAA